MLKRNLVDYDVIIIGAGVIGASVALALSRRSLKTLNVDALPAAGYGSTSASSAVVRPFYSALEACALAHEARHHWKRWPEFLDTKDESGFAEYSECGMLVLMAAGDEARFAPNLRAMDEVGVTYSLLNPDEVMRRLPGLTMQSFGPPKSPDDPSFGIANDRPLAGGLLIPEAGYVSDPQLAAHNLQRAAEARGAEFRFNTRIDAILRVNGRVTGVTSQAGQTIEAPVVVNVAGPHSSKISAMAGIADDMRTATRPLRHEVAHVGAPGDFDLAHGACVLADGDAGVYLRPEVGGNMLIGTLDPECDGKDIVDADDYNPELTEQWTRQVWRTAQRFPELGIPNTAQGVVGLYDLSDDWMPIYDCSSLGGFYMAIGTSGNQFKNAPMIGPLMATLIEACEAGQDHDREPVSFTLPYLDRAIDLGFFSRLRQAHAGSSGTVLA
jgi:sarcosine oxidase subunit beta